MPKHEPEVIEARRRRLEADLRAEGWPESHIRERATPAFAEQMLAYEKQTIDAIYTLFGGVR